eukprot:5722604-Prymnesium_polylepis.1
MAMELVGSRDLLARQVRSNPLNGWARRRHHRDRRHRLASGPGRAQQFRSAHAGESAPDSSGRAFRPHLVLRCALCREQKRNARGGQFFYAPRHEKRAEAEHVEGEGKLGLRGVLCAPLRAAELRVR